MVVVQIIDYKDLTKYCKEMDYLLLLMLSVTPAYGWQYFTSMNDLILYGTPLEQEHLHSEYVFGDCTKKGNVLYTHVHLEHLDVLGKLIVRGWVDLIRIPTCIRLRATSYEYDLFRSTAYNFQFCVPRITYCHSQKRYKYFYYEWYIPEDMIGGMNWDIYFFGSPALVWQ